MAKAANGPVQGLVTELQAARVVLEANANGLRGLQRLQFTPASLSEIDAALNFQVTRLGLIVVAIDALLALIKHGYPDLPAEMATQSVLDELKAMADAISASVTLFVAEAEAVAGKIKIQ
jgi:hypothetical protein